MVSSESTGVEAMMLPFRQPSDRHDVYGIFRYVPGDECTRRRRPCLHGEIRHFKYLSR